MKKIIYNIFKLGLIVFTLTLLVGQEVNAQFSQLRSSTSNGAKWTSGGAYTTFGVAGQSSISTLIGGGTYTSSVGFLHLPFEVSTNEIPIAFSTPGEIFYNLGSIYHMEGVDPNGDNISFEVLTQPSLGSLSFPDANKNNQVLFTPEVGLLTDVLYHDSFTFIVKEVGGEAQQSEIATVSFSFKLRDEPHVITSFTKSNSDFNLVWTDQLVNPSYNITMDYFDLSNPAAPVMVNVVNVDVDDNSYNLNSNVLDYTINSSAATHPYLFNNDLVFITISLTTPGGFSDFACYVLDNTDPTVVKTLASSDGLFFALGTEQSVPENNKVLVQMSAVELGEYDVSEITMQLTSSPTLGTLSQPVLIENSDNLLIWEAEYTSTQDIGGLEEISFSVTHPGRDLTETGVVKITIEDANDAPSLDDIFNQQMLEDGTLDIDANFSDPDNALIFSAVANNDADKVNLSTDGNTLTITALNNFSGIISISGIVTEVGTDDAFAVSHSFDVEILPQNDAPVLASVSNESVDEDNTVEILLSATDQDGDVLVFDYAAVVDNPAIASATISGDLLSIVPVENATGQVSVSVVADDRAGASNSKSTAEIFTVDFNPVNDQPTVVQTLATQTIVENFTGYDLDLAAYFSDVETLSENLAYSVSGNTEVSFSFSGSVATITTTADYFGTETISIIASDGLLNESMSVDFVVNEESADVLVAQVIANQILEEDFTSFNIDISDVFSDASDVNAVFTYNLSGNNFVITSIDNVNQTITITSAQNVSENETLLLVGSTGGFSTFTNINLIISSVNDAPILEAISNKSIFEDNALTNFILETSDVDNIHSELTVTATSDNQTVIADGDISISNTNGFFYLSASPNANVNGSSNITVTVTDSDKISTSTFLLSVLNVNDEPTQEVATVTDATEDVIYSVDLATLFADIDGDNLSFEINAPSWLTLDGTTLTGTPLNENVGNVDLLVTALDGAGGSIQSNYSFMVTNVNDAPTFSLPSSFTVNEDEKLTEFLINVEDVDSDFSALTFTVTSADQTKLKNSDLSFSNSGGFFTITAKPLKDVFGTVDINLSANDGDKTGTKTVQLQIVNVNDAPLVAVTTIPSATEDLAYNVSVAEYFTDIDGDNLTITLSGNPTWLFLDSEYVLIGTPLNDAAVNVEITLTVSDGTVSNVSQAYALSVTSVNDAPTVEITTLPSATEDIVYSTSITNYFLDEENDALTITLSNNPNWLSYNANTGILSGTPENADSGTFEVTLTVSDGTADPVVQTYTLQVDNVNDAPTIDVVTIPSATEGVNYSVSLENYFFDEEGVTLTITASNLPSWLVLDGNTLVGTPENSNIGSFEFTLSVSDGETATISQVYTLLVINVNNAPVVEVPTGKLITLQNSTFTYTISSSTFSDIDVDDVLTLSVEEFPSWMTLTSGTLEGTPSYGEIGNYTITIKANDQEGLSVSEIIDLEVQFVVYDIDFSGSNTAVCEGETTIVNASGAIDYNWYDISGTLLQEGGTSYDIVSEVSLQILIEGKDSQSRVNPNRVTYDLMVNPNPEIPSITGAETLSVIEIAGLSYQWYLDNIAISGANSTAITPEENGAYSVEVTTEMGCMAISESVVFAITSLDLNHISLDVFPVPANNYLNIEGGINLTEMEYKVYDIRGIEMRISSEISSNKIILDISNLDKGVYILKVKFNDSLSSTRFIKN